VALTDVTGTLRLRGKAIMPDLSRFMRHRVTGDHKQKTARSKDQQTKETTAGAAVAKQLGQLCYMLGLHNCDVLIWSCGFRFIES